MNWNQFTLTKLPPVLVVKVTYSVWLPEGIGEAVTGVLEAHVCQPPVPFTAMVANGVAVSEPSRNWIVPMPLPATAEA